MALLLLVLMQRIGEHAILLMNVSKDEEGGKIRREGR